MVVVREMMKNGILRVMRGGMRGRLWDTRRIEKVSQINFNFQQYSYYTIQNLNLNEYHEITENTLNNILDKCNVIEESIEDVDITYAVSDLLFIFHNSYFTSVARGLNT